MATLNFRKLVHTTTAHVAHRKKKIIRKTKFEILIDREIDKILKDYHRELVTMPGNLESPAMKIKKKRAELEQEIKDISFGEQIKEAIEILNSKTEDLEEEKIALIQQDLSNASTIISTIHKKN